jgi:hypothetical protein
MAFGCNTTQAPLAFLVNLPFACTTFIPLSLSASLLRGCRPWLTRSPVPLCLMCRAVYFEFEGVMNHSYSDVSAHAIIVLLLLSGFVAFLLST